MTKKELNLDEETLGEINYTTISKKYLKKYD